LRDKTAIRSGNAEVIHSFQKS